MRQIGNLPERASAERFAAYLMTTGIAAHAEEQDGAWVIWVRDENQIDTARTHLAEYRSQPEADRYRGAEAKAERIRRSAERQRDESRKKVVHMRGRWGAGAVGGRRRPLVITIIVLCILVFLGSNSGRNHGGVVFRTLLFVDPVHLLQESWDPQSAKDVLIDIRRGEIWRLVTPIFLHFDTMHIVFNMLMFYQLGSVVEDRRGTWRLGMLILSIAMVSNLVQCLLPPGAGGSWSAGGMSGVVYGLLGYVWMKSRFQPEQGLMLHPTTLVILVGWMLLGFSGLMEQFGVHIANWAHGAGFAAGVVIGYAPVLFRR